MRVSTKQIVKSKVIRCSQDTAWRKWTTHEGLLSFFGRDNRIELTPGGAFEIYFLMDNPPGLRGSEGCTVLSFLPQEMLSFSWNAPPHFPEIRASEYRTWVVVQLKADSADKTEITLTHLGWPDDSAWDPVFAYFDAAWESVLEELAAGLHGPES